MGGTRETAAVTRNSSHSRVLELPMSREGTRDHEDFNCVSVLYQSYGVECLYHFQFLLSCIYGRKWFSVTICHRPHDIM